ncbi:unnamed protein product [Rhizophagus irregularis]|uniref:Uncharacterized protein n=1 Tax=Rhizophagus irregularis TaxID=588596 RepID=A0A915ZNM9_9GLOM|nr:unnamed protein product [Rhizophagus irregularis]
MPEVSPANVPDSDIAQLKHHAPVCEAVPEITVPVSPSLCEDDKKTDEFLDLVQKKSVSDRIRQRNKEKKIQQPSDRSILEKSEISGNFANKIHNFHDQNIDKSIEDNQLDCNLSKNDSSGDDDFTVPSEQALERDLMQQLSLPSTSIDTEILLTPPVIDKKQQFSVTAECIVYMFRKAVRSGYDLRKVMTKELMKFVLSTKLKSILRNNKYTKKLKNYFQILVLLIYVSNYLGQENYINYLMQ